jgi:hypothetical protein
MTRLTGAVYRTYVMINHATVKRRMRIQCLEKMRDSIEQQTAPKAVCIGIKQAAQRYILE